MTRTLLKISLPLIILMFFSSWSQIPIEKGALISISVTSKGAMQNGAGIVFTITDQETNISYKSESLGLISPHSIIKDLPPGKYTITKIEVPLGSVTYTNTSMELQEYFGVLEIENDKYYYLGNFNGVRDIGSRNVFYLTLDGEGIPDKLLKKLKRKGFDLSEADFIKTYPYSQESFLVY